MIDIQNSENLKYVKSERQRVNFPTSEIILHVDINVNMISDMKDRMKKKKSQLTQQEKQEAVQTNTCCLFTVV